MATLTMEIEQEIELEINCSECGAGLCGEYTACINGDTVYIDISPCRKCIEDAKDEGYDKGKEDAENA
jgi:hypothetical protein